jgi:hypothetical protein
MYYVYYQKSPEKVMLRIGRGGRYGRHFEFRRAKRTTFATVMIEVLYLLVDAFDNVNRFSSVVMKGLHDIFIILRVAHVV